MTSPDPRRSASARRCSAWVSRDRAVYPRDVIYPPEQSAQDVEQQSNVEMVSSQDTAIAAALTELGYTLPLRIEVLAVTKGVAGRRQAPGARPHPEQSTASRITDVEQVTKAVQRTGVGGPSPSSYAGRQRDRAGAGHRRGRADDAKRAVVGHGDRHRLRLPLPRLGAARARTSAGPAPG